MQGRTALSYGLDIDIDHEDGEVGGDLHEMRERDFTDRGIGLGWLLGAGVSKAIFQLDVEVDVVALANVFQWVNGNAPVAPNDMASISMTLDFAKKSSSSSSGGSSYTPPPAPMDEPAVEDEPAGGLDMGDDSSIEF